MRRISGFTIVEMIVCVGIIAVLASILQPIFARAVRSAKIESSVQRLRQLHVALTLYRDENPNPRCPAGLNLPDYDTYISHRFGLPLSMFRTPCGYKDGIRTNRLKEAYQYHYFDAEPNHHYYEQRGEQGVLISDSHCGGPASEVMNPAAPKFGLAITVEGQVKRINRPGDIDTFTYWDEHYKPN